MEELRRVARESLQQAHIPPSIILPAEIALPDSIDALWQEISSQKPGSDKEVNPIHRPFPLFDVFSLTMSWQVCEELLVALSFLGRWPQKSISDQDKETIDRLYEWASNAALPSPVFAETSEPDDLSDGGSNGPYQYYSC